MPHSTIHNLDTLRTLLELLSRVDDRVELSRQQAAELAESFRDCRLGLMRLESHKLSEAQLHRLQQMDNMLQTVVSGHALAEGIAPEAKRTLESFGWSDRTAN